MEDFYCDEVLSGKTPVKKVFESETVLAYHHTRPYWPVHIVVVPKRHVGSLLDLQPDDPLLDELMRATQGVARTVQRVHGGCRVLTNLGEYQDSKHLHYHVTYGELLK